MSSFLAGVINVGIVLVVVIGAYALWRAAIRMRWCYDALSIIHTERLLKGMIRQSADGWQMRKVSVGQYFSLILRFVFLAALLIAVYAPMYYFMFKWFWAHLDIFRITLWKGRQYMDHVIWPLFAYFGVSLPWILGWAKQQLTIEVFEIEITL